MTEAQARARLTRMIAMDTEPLLTADDLDLLVEIAKKPDSDGRTPSDVDWVETWDLNHAAMTGWEWKAGKASAGIAFSEDQQSFSVQQIYDHCMAQAHHYARGTGGSVTVDSFLGSC